MSLTFVLTSTGYAENGTYRHVDVQASSTLIQDKNTTGLPDRREVQAIHVYGLQGSQSHFQIDLKKAAGLQHLWRGAHYPVGPKDLPLYVIDDAQSDYNGDLFWGTLDGNGVPEEPNWSYEPTSPEGDTPDGKASGLQSSQSRNWIA